MILQGEPEALRHAILLFLDRFIFELKNLPAAHADQMIVMVPGLIELIHGGAIQESPLHRQPGFHQAADSAVY